MSNLIKYNVVNLPKEVSNLSRSVYQANSSVMIKKIDDLNIVVNSIHQSINRAIADKGVNMEIEDMNYLKRSITDDILKDFNTLTLQDIVLCFNMGVRGNLGEYFGLNVVTFYGWLKKYKEETLPKMYSEVKNYLSPAQEVVENVDYKKLDLDKIENICSAIELFIKDGVYEFNDYGNIHYNFLDKLGLFDDISDNQKELIMEDAEQSFIADMKNKNLTLLAQGKKFQLQDISDLMEKVEYGEKDTQTMIDICYKKLFIKKFIVNFKIINKNSEELKSYLLNKVEENYGK